MKVSVTKKGVAFLKIGFGTFLVVIATWLWLIQRPQNNRQAINDVVDCFQKRNAGCLLDFMPENEVTSMKLDRAKMQKFLDVYINDKFRGFEPDGKLRIEPGTDAEVMLYAIQRYRHPDGRIIDWGFAVYYTDDGPKASSLFGSLLLASYATDMDSRRTIGFYEAASKSAKQSTHVLNGIGINGVLINENMYFDWNQWEQRMFAFAERERAMRVKG